MRLSLLLGQLEFFWGKVSQLSRQFYPVQSECMESAHTQLWGQGWGQGRGLLQGCLDTDKSLWTVPFRATVLHMVLGICLKLKSDRRTRACNKKSS